MRTVNKHQIKLIKEQSTFVQKTKINIRIISFLTFPYQVYKTACKHVAAFYILKLFLSLLVKHQERSIILYNVLLPIIKLNTFCYLLPLLDYVQHNEKLSLMNIV